MPALGTPEASAILMAEELYRWAIPAFHGAPITDDHRRQMRAKAVALFDEDLVNGIFWTRNQVVPRAVEDVIGMLEGDRETLERSRLHLERIRRDQEIEVAQKELFDLKRLMPRLVKLGTRLEDLASPLLAKRALRDASEGW